MNKKLFEARTAEDIRNHFTEMDYQNQAEHKFISYLHDNPDFPHLNTEIETEVLAYLVLGDKTLEREAVEALGIETKNTSKMFSDNMRSIMKYSPRDRQEARNALSKMLRKIKSSAVRSLEELIARNQ